MIHYAARDSNTEDDQIIVLLELPPTVETTPLGVIRYIPDESETEGFPLETRTFEFLFGRPLRKGQIAKLNIGLCATPTTPGEAKQLGWVR